MINKMILILSLPALIVHELTHIISIIILGVKGQGVEITKDVNNNLEVIVHYKTENEFKKNLISLSPLWGILLWLLSIFLTTGFLSFILFSYLIIFIKVFLPSKHDVDMFIESMPIDCEIPKYIE